jgi:hypothetical protein
MYLHFSWRESRCLFFGKNKISSRKKTSNCENFHKNPSDNIIYLMIFWKAGGRMAIAFWSALIAGIREDDRKVGNSQAETS